MNWIRIEISFQMYKFLLATRILDYGMQLKTLLYMEQIANQIKKDPSKFEPKFIERVSPGDIISSKKSLKLKSLGLHLG